MIWEETASNLPSGKHRSRGGSLNEPKNIDPSQRVKEFPGEPLKVNHNKHLFCHACREELSLKSSSLHSHFQSSKNIEGKKRQDRKKAREKDIAELLKGFNSQNHLKGGTLPENQQVFRVKIVTCFLRAVEMRAFGGECLPHE